ncbi:DUF4229 domain-containing protein [Isoptericola haloaureus]|uniref:DUF4229 domain-containing protein n=1 Tax=Isoptericola haloaureus TaxID=1542902 RepID=A0ABU7Z9E1_9MICO
MPLVIYSALRLLILVAVLVLGYVVGLGGWLLPLVALVVAFAVSYLALPRQRDAAALWLAERDRERKERRERVVDEDAAAEDAALDGDPAARTDDPAGSPQQRS